MKNPYQISCLFLTLVFAFAAHGLLEAFLFGCGISLVNGALEHFDGYEDECD